MNDRRSRPGDPRSRAEAAFKAVTSKVPPLAAAPRPVVLPNAREQVTLRLDREVLEHFQADGPGWQDRINAALKTLVAR